jgi:aspartyl-tRNA(Asn)/glutamyl-tRNA(Gln) amidotransferase subunit C
VSSSLSRDDVAKVAKLARLRLSDEELNTFTEQLGGVLEHANDMNSLDLSALEPTSNPFGLTNVTREDIIWKSLDRAAVLAEAPDAQDGRFAVPRILGEAP